MDSLPVLSKWLCGCYPSLPSACSPVSPAYSVLCSCKAVTYLFKQTSFYPIMISNPFAKTKTISIIHHSSLKCDLFLQILACIATVYISWFFLCLESIFRNTRPAQDRKGWVTRIHSRRLLIPLKWALTVTPSGSSVTSSSSPVVASTEANPAPYSGPAEDCNGFLLQCLLAFEMQSHLSPPNKSRSPSSFPYWQDECSIEPKRYENKPEQSCWQWITSPLISQTASDASVGEKLYHLCQGKMLVTEYDLKFRTLAAASGWNKCLLLTT